MAETSGFFRPLIEFFFPSLKPEDMLFYYGYVRKVLHFVVYAFLGFLAFRAFSVNGRAPRKALSIALLISLAVAATDEYMQSFDPSRTSSVYDVAIDMAGATSAILATYFLRTRRDRRVEILQA